MSFLVSAAVHAQSDTTGTFNRQRTTPTNQYRTDSTQTGQQGVQPYQDTRNRSRTTGTEANPIENATDTVGNYSQGTTSGSLPYDTTDMAPSSNYKSNSIESNGMSDTQPTGDGSANTSIENEAGTSGTTGTGPSGQSTSGAPGRPRYEEDAALSKDRTEMTTLKKKAAKTPKKNKKVDDQDR